MRQVVYINTSLKTKALAHHAVPTITCTSSNVVQTVLTAFAQVWPKGCGAVGRAVEVNASSHVGRCLAWLCLCRRCGLRVHGFAAGAVGAAGNRLADEPRPAACPQVPGCNVWYGPDTYMGRNLAQLFTSLANMR